jgi:polyhydroxybutyrate depolymerase
MKLILLALLCCSCLAQKGQYIDIDPDRRAAKVVLPSDYREDQSYPVVFLLHGYSMNSETMDFFTGVSQWVTKKQFILVIPNGRKDQEEKQFWNAGVACCNLYGESDVDQAYLTALIREVHARYATDNDRVHLYGFSNGGFMGIRMACERSDLIQSVASFAGTMPVDENHCRPEQSVRFFHMHGTDDQVIRYKRGSFQQLPEHLGAQEMVDSFAQHQDCEIEQEIERPALWVNFNKERNFILEQNYQCKVGDLKFWTMVGAGHRILFTRQFSSQVLNTLLLPQ